MKRKFNYGKQYFDPGPLKNCSHYHKYCVPLNENNCFKTNPFMQMKKQFVLLIGAHIDIRYEVNIE